MKNVSAESINPDEEFNKGLELFELNEYVKANEAFKRVHEFARDNSIYLSYYGLSIAFAGGNPQVGVELCHRALKSDSFNPLFYLNLGKVHARMKHRKEAIIALKQGLKIDRNNQKIIAELNKIGLRSDPAISFLSRNSLVNIYFGKLKTFLKEL